MRTRRGRAKLIAAGVAATLGLIGAGMAMAAQQPVVASDTVGNSYSQGTYTMDQGERLQFQNAGPSNRHDVWSRVNGPDGKKLFISPTITPGQTTTVKGTEYLTAGTYEFICNVHPLEMSGNLVVTTNGIPVGRPNIGLNVLGKSLEKVVSGGLRVKIFSTAQVADVELEAMLGKTTIGTLTGVSLVAGSQVRKLKLSKAGKSKLADREKATVRVTGEVPFGAPHTAKKKLT